MIFFYMQVARENRQPEQRLIAWCEFYDTDPAAAYAKLKRGVLAAAKEDNLCQIMKQKALERFGIEIPDDDTKPLPDHVESVFYYWAHPSVGNAGALNLASRQPHDFKPPQGRARRLNWSAATRDLDDVTRKAIEDLAASKTFERFDIAARDEVRVMGDETELARAIIGEITCAGVRRIEKILALRLCASQQLTDVLSEMLIAFLEFLLDKKISWDRTKLEYIAYYFPTLAPILRDRAKTAYRRYFLMGLAITCGIPIAGIGDLVQAAREHVGPSRPETGVSDDESNQVIEQIASIWLRLPPPMRCIVLINEFRTLWSDDVFSQQEQKDIGKLAVTLAPLVQDNVIQLDGDWRMVMKRENHWLDETDHHNLRWKDLQWLHSWSRDEQALATIGYRALLCPLWAGTGTHTIKNFKFWHRVAGSKFNQVAIALGLFAFWRLYYDKRITGNHTFVETVDQTYHDLLGGQLSTATVECALSTTGHANMLDDHDIYGDVALDENILDPFRTLSLLERSCGVAVSNDTDKPAKGDKLFGWLLGEISKRRQQLENQGYFVPQWTWDFTARTGLAVQRAGPLYGQIRAATTELDNHALQALILAYVGPPEPAQQETDNSGQRDKILQAASRTVPPPGAAA
jgi:hypothetical protein